ncbi:hypothetical protein CEN44_16355 [Fischerella muscicola CCMEE 5323]|uniref:Uncharacterized protein n=1 Tax=Fischerella muscicola CCMEE 5323 TaxID=2019572 RepID=A0A2N6K0Z5_FISMU|nr:hypothetical protein [Fischerella sp. FACHB-380]PLZ87986.1 hypothetical protein CEN44_16355 [Fischerella muscicola CCMEE 5323]
MFIQDLLICLQITTDIFTNKKPSDCLSNLPCNCPNPGKKLECEDCEYLEACLSEFAPIHSQIAASNLSTSPVSARICSSCDTDFETSVA